MTVFAVFGVRCQRPVRRWAVAAIIAWHKATTAWVLYFSNPSAILHFYTILVLICHVHAIYQKQGTAKAAAAGLVRTRSSHTSSI